MNLFEFQKNLKKISLKKIYSECMKELEAEIIDLNHSQLEVGKDSESALLPEYEDQERYYSFKQSIGSKSGRRYDLKLEGNFYEAFFGKIESNLDYTIDSKDEKRDKLVDLTSIEIFGLTDDNTRKFIENHFYSCFMEKLRKALLLN